MNKLVKMVLITASVGMLGVTGCRSVPDTTAQNFIEGVLAGKADSEFYNTYCTDKAAAFFSLAGDKLNKRYQGAEIEITDTKIDGDKATCMVNFISNGGKDRKQDLLKLVKVDGEWKVDVDVNM